MKSLLVVFGLLIAGCATAPPPAPIQPCGEPCATMTCPSAYICIVDKQCNARCQPEPVKPGLP